MGHEDGAARAIARLAELVGTGPAGPDTDPRVVLDVIANSLDAEAVVAGRMDDRLHVDHVVDRRGIGLLPGDAVTLHDQHFGAPIVLPGQDQAHARYESLVLAGTSGLCRGLSVPLLTRDGLVQGRLCALFADARPMSDDGWTLLWLAARVLMDMRDIVDWRYQALHDPLTGLANRLLLRDRLQHAVAIAHRDRASLAVLLLDLDDFKSINDTFGHRTGDAVLAQVATRLRRPLRESDTIARLGGDEFVILLLGVDVHGAAEVARKLLRALRRPYLVGNVSRSLWASIGIALYPDDARSPAELLEQADEAMYRVKQRDGGYELSATGPTPSPPSLRTPYGPRS
jgi:diguanylate cyclase (GGDEF)-like protein